MSRHATIAWRLIVVALLGSIWWQVGGGAWAERMYWRAYFAIPTRDTEAPKPTKAGDFDPLEAGSAQTLKDLTKRAQAETAAASAPKR